MRTLQQLQLRRIANTPIFEHEIEPEYMKRKINGGRCDLNIDVSLDFDSAEAKAMILRGRIFCWQTSRRGYCVDEVAKTV